MKISRPDLICPFKSSFFKKNMELIIAVAGAVMIVLMIFILSIL